MATGSGGRKDLLDQLASDLSAGRLSRRQFILRAAAAGLSISAIAPILSACGGDDETTAETGVTAGTEGTTSATEAAGGGSGRQDMNILVWEGYSADDVLDPFRREYDISVTAELITSDPDAINRLRAGDVNVFDIINVNNPWAREIMYPEGLIIPLDQEKFKGYFDMMMPAFAWPYQWAMSLDGSELLGMTQRFGPFNFVVNTDKISQQMAEDQGFELFKDPDMADRYGVLTWDNWNIMHMLTAAGINPFVDHTDEDRNAFGEMASQIFAGAKVKTDDMGSMNTSLINGEIDAYFTGGVYTASPARLEGFSNIWAVTPNTGPIDGKGGIVWIEVTSLVNNPNLSEHAADFLEYVQGPEVSHTVAMAEGTHNPVAQMGNEEVLNSFTPEELDCLQYETLPDDLERSADYDVVPDYDQLIEIYSQALRES